MSELTRSLPWKALQEHHKNICKQKMSDWFVSNSSRFSQFSLENLGLLMDYSKNRITKESMSLLIDLARKSLLESKRSDLFAGKIVNLSERRAAMHMALRNRNGYPMEVDHQNVMPLVHHSLKRMSDWVTQIQNQTFLGFSGKPIDTIVNIGIGGSDLGPQFLLSALSAYVNPKLHYHFLSTHDEWFVRQTLSKLNPETTLFIMVSKTFTTEETVMNANAVKQWQLSTGMKQQDLQRHWIAVTAAPNKAAEMGITLHILPFWEWVGGRYSIWSAVGLIVAIAIGMPQFEQFLEGGFAMDRHFLQEEYENNMPIILALLEIWYQNFFKANTHVVLPYGQRLHLLPDYLQQLHMESLGKGVNQQGEKVDYETGSILWGNVGTNSQHSFHQLLMQGTHLIPADFILALDNDKEEHLLSHALAQTQVLMQGYSLDQIHLSQMEQQQTLDGAFAHRVIPGNSPTTTIILKKLSPYSLGVLIALYEHKVFSYAAILNINPWDQWGVERGKQIAREIKDSLHDNNKINCYDSSTQGLLKWIKMHVSG